MLLEGSEILGAGVFGVFCLEVGVFSSFSSFLSKLAVVDRVPRVAVVVGGAVKFNEATGGAGEEKMVLYGEIS